jgi:hypothetical protein
MTITSRIRAVVAGAMLVMSCLTHLASAAESPTAAGYPGSAPGRAGSADDGPTGSRTSVARTSRPKSQPPWSGAKQ